MSASRAACAVLAAFVLALASVARAADVRSTPSSLGASVILGEPFVLDAELCSELFAGARDGERVRLAIASDAHTNALDPLAALDASVDEILLDPSAAHAGDDRVLCERVRSAGSIVIRGGRYLDWYQLLTPSNKRSGLCAALVDARRSGALLVASGAAGAFMAERAIVDRASLARPVRNPRDASTDVIVNGIGLVSGTIDASGAPHASFERLLELAPRDSGDVLVFVDGPAAWIARESEHRVSEVRGPGAALLVDLREARRAHRTLRGARLSVLVDRDRWNERDHRVSAQRSVTPQRSVTDDRSVISSTRPLAAAPPSTADARFASSFDAGALRAEIACAFGVERASSLVIADAARTLTLRADADTQFGFDGGEALATCAGLVLDVAWPPLGGAR